LTAVQVFYMHILYVAVLLNHGLCDSSKLLYKRCAKSMGRPKFRPPTAPTFFSIDLNETWNQERYPGYDPTCKNLVDVGRREGVCVGRALSVTFCVPSFLYSCSRLQVTPEDRSRPFMAQNACFRVRESLLGVSMIKKIMFGGQNSSKTWFWGP